MGNNLLVNYIFPAFLLLILATYSGMAFAGLKENLIELGQTQDPNKIKELLALITASKKLDRIDTLGLTQAQKDGIFGAMLQATPIDYENYDKLLAEMIQSAAYSADNPPKNALLLIADLVNKIDSLPEKVRIYLSENQIKIYLVLSNSLKHSIEADDIKSLHTIWLWLDSDYKKWLVSDISKLARSDLSPYLKEGLSKLLFGQHSDDYDRFQISLAASVYYDLTTQRLNEGERISVFKNTFGPTLEQAESGNKLAPMLLPAHINFIVYNWRIIVRELENHKDKMAVFPISLGLETVTELTKELLKQVPALFDELKKDKLEWLFDRLFVRIFVLYLEGMMPADKNLNEQILAMILPYLYKSKLEEFSKMVFSEGPRPIQKEENTLSSAEPSKIICNQDGYDEGVTISCVRGKPLKLDDQTPIGYDVHLPQGEVRAILTQVYGGIQQKDRKENMYRPGILDPLDKYLLANGIAIVKLNLVDLRDLQEMQAKMPEDLHRRLHESINKYFAVFNDPKLLRDLHPDLLVLQGKPNFLFGASFGGRTAVRHAELYPGTFKGYLSFDGGLDFGIMDSTRSEIRPPFSWSQQQSQKWLNPINEVKKIQDPVLLLHNLDDNNVRAAVSVAFYQKAIQEKKELVKLLRLLLTERGSPIPADQKIYNKGHFLPIDPEILKRLADYVLQFMVQGPSSMPAASELRAQVHRRGGYDISTGLGQHFSLPESLWLSELFRHYYATNQPKITEELWLKEYLPLIQSLSLVHINSVMKASGNSSIEKLIKSREDQFSEQEFANGIAKHAHGFADFLIEKYHWKMDAALLAELIKNNEKIRQIFKTWILSPETSGLSSVFTSYVLYEFLRANPIFTTYLTSEFFKALEPETTDNIFTKIKKDFESDINKAQALAKMTWQQAYGNILAEQRVAKEKSLKLCAVSIEKFQHLANELSAAKLNDIAQIQMQFQELLSLADPCLSDLARVANIRAAYRKLVEHYEQCSSTQCKFYYTDSLLSLGLLMGHKDFMKESVRKAAAALRGSYPPAQDLGEIIVPGHLMPLIPKLSEKHRWLSPQDLEELKLTANEFKPGFTRDQYDAMVRLSQMIIDVVEKDHKVSVDEVRPLLRKVQAAKSGKGINHQDPKTGNTLLHGFMWAADQSGKSSNIDPNVVDAFMIAGADVTIKNKKGQTPLKIGTLVWGGRQSSLEERLRLLNKVYPAKYPLE